MRWISEFVMGLSRYRNSPSCFWDREIRRRRDRDVLQRHKAGCSDVIARPLLLRALNRQKSAAEAGTTAVSDCKEIGINTVVEFIDRRPIGLVRAENAALHVKVQRLKDKNKQVNQQLEERNSCFREYKRETSSKCIGLVRERDTYKGQMANVQKANANMQAEIALLRQQKANAITQAENAALEVKSLEENIRQLTQQQNKINSIVNLQPGLVEQLDKIRDESIQFITQQNYLNCSLSVNETDLDEEIMNRLADALQQYYSEGPP